MKKHFYYIALVLFSLSLFTSCDNEDDNGGGQSGQETVFGQGVFILNEGNYTNQIQGSLSHVSYESGEIANGLFYSVNNRWLGSTPNSMVIDPVTGEIYIACTDDNRVEVTDGNLKSVGFITVVQPREMVLSDGCLYVSCYGGKVVKIDTKTRKMVGESEIIGANLEGIAVRGGFIYVCNSWNPDWTYNAEVVKLNASTLEKVSVLKVATNPTTLKSSGTDLYLLSSGNYADVQSQIQKIDSADRVEYLCDGTFFDVKDENLFVIDSRTDFTTGETANSYFLYSWKNGRKDFIPPCELFAPCAIGVDSKCGRIVIASYRKGSYGFADYSAKGDITVFDLDSKEYQQFEAGVNPSVLVFL